VVDPRLPIVGVPDAAGATFGAAATGGATSTGGATATGRATATSGAPGAAVDRDTLVRENLALVGHIARETAARLPRHLGTDDLAGAGALALGAYLVVVSAGLAVLLWRYRWAE
jgi:hypothetical protein